MLTILLSNGFANRIKHCQIIDRIRRDNIYNAGLSSKTINIVTVRLNLSKYRGFQKKISFYPLVSFNDSVMTE
jgi:hypothetical protein